MFTRLSLVMRAVPMSRAGVDAHREDLVVLAHVALDVEAEVGQEPVHDGRVAELVLHDLGDHVLFLDRRAPW